MNHLLIEPCQAAVRSRGSGSVSLFTTMMEQCTRDIKERDAWP